MAEEGLDILFVAALSSLPAIVAAVSAMILAARWGYGPLAKEGREQRAELTKTLRDRLDLAEDEIARQEGENADLREHLKHVEFEKDRLEERVLKLEREIIRRELQEERDER